MIYHLLPEAEAFSDRTGGAISRWIANVIGDDADARIVCPRADASWKVPESRIVRLRSLDVYYQALRASRRRLPWALSNVAIRAAFARLAPTLGPHDTVYIHNRPEFVPPFRRGRRGPRVILHLHNSHLATYPAAIVKAASADLTIFCSQYLEQEALRRLPGLGPSLVIANGADPLLFQPRPGARVTSENAALPTVLFVGRLVPEKGVHVLVEALKILEARAIPVAARIVGSASVRTRKTTAYVRALRQRATGNTTFLPHVWGAALIAEFHRATLLCCPSVWNESFGMVNVEAMASELAVVASKVGGITEVFADGGAILVPPDDAVALADALALLIGDQSLRLATAARGRAAFLDRFQWSVIRRHYLAAVYPKAVAA